MEMSNLNQMRLAVKNETVVNKYRAVKLFITHINNRLIKLGKMSAYQNALLVEEYYKLNAKEVPKLALQSVLYLTRQTPYSPDMDIDMLEVNFRRKVESCYMEDSDLFQTLDVLPSSLFEHHLGENEEAKVDIKAIFKTLEKLNKEVTVLYKVNGYLKELRDTQKNIAYNNDLLKPVCVDLQTQAKLSGKHYIEVSK